MGWRTIKKYLQRPDQPAVSRHKPSKLDPFKSAIADLLAQDPTVSSAVIEQRLRSGAVDAFIRSTCPRAAEQLLAAYERLDLCRRI